MLAEWLGRGQEMAALELAFHAGDISNRAIADISAGWLSGRHASDAWNEIAVGPWIAGMEQTFNALSDCGTRLLLGTITSRFIAETLGERHGFAAASGTEMHITDGVLSGRVSRHFNEHDKLRFVEAWCSRNGFQMSQVAAVGDSRSDIPLFRRVGMSIALNATADAREAATQTLDTDDLRNVLPLLQPAREET